MVKKAILGFIRIYQKYFSLDQGMLGKALGTRGLVCRFKPTCSEYTYQAVERYGVIKGGLMGAKRVLRCNPFCKGGEDPLK